MKKSDKGIVTLSFDCEAKWGMADLNLEWKKDLTNENLIEAYEYILEILKKVGIEKIFEIIFIPPLKLFGIQKEAMNIIIVGMTIGIQYGGGMLIKDVKSGKIDKQSVFLSVSLLNLLHAVIEDTILMALIGGHISGILFARIIFSLIVSYLIFMIYKRYFKVV